MTSGIFTVSGYYRFDAERAWARYAIAQNGNKPIAGSRCAWSTAPIDPAKVTISNVNGGHVTRTNWKFDPSTMLPAATATSAANSTPTTTLAGAARSRTATGTTGNAFGTSGSQNAVADPNVLTSSGSTDTTAQGALQGVKSNATSAVSGSVNSLTTTTVASVASRARSPTG